MKIIVDAFGGDNAPLEVIKGCVKALEVYNNIEIILVGSKEIIEKTAKENNILIAGIGIEDAPDVITMEDEAGDIMKSKNQSSMAVGLKLLASGGADAFLSAGNSGALIMGATMIVKRIKGIKRPAFSPLMPKVEGQVLLIDSGANVECRPEMLQQFGIMGSVYMDKICGIKNPRVALANVGTEDHKGGELQHKAFALLKEAPINFIGNIEARDIPHDAADVIVADGFTGNIIVKMYEGVASALMLKIKELFMKNFKTKLAAALVLKDMKELKAYMDYNNYGAAPIMGVAKPVLKTHGSAKADTFISAIKSVIDYTEKDVIGEIQRELEVLKNGG